MMRCWLLLILAFLACSVEVQSKKSLRYVSWNVNDNDGMGGNIDRKIVRQLLGIEAFNVSVKAYFDIYAISLQENCYYCDSDDVHKFANVFLAELNKERQFMYDFIGHTATRKSKTCKAIACRTGQHGTTHMLVLAKRGMVSFIDVYRKNKCSSGFFKNAEKGIAAVKFQVRGFGGPVVCVAGVHLDSGDPEERRDCVRDFMSDYGGSWRRCDVTFFGGSFNTHTGKKGGVPHSRTLTDNQVRILYNSDEMRGKEPYGGRRLIDYINSQNGVDFYEGPLDFYPTYSLRPTKECDGIWPCYRGDRPPSWTNRIICNSCKTFAYFSLPIQRSDHSPVVGIYTV